MTLAKRIPSELEVFNISNITTGVDICNSKSGKIEILSYDQESFDIILPKPVGSGMLVNIRAKITVNTDSFEFNATGKIEKVRENPDKSYFLHIELNQYNADQWKTFLDAQNAEKTRKESIFKSMRSTEE